MSTPLHLTEQEVAAWVMPKGWKGHWAEKAIELERRGFPPVDPVFGGRCRLAIEAWFLERYGVGASKVPFHPDGGEICPTPKRRGSNGETGPTADVLPIGSRKRP